MYETIRGKNIIMKVARGDHIEPGVNDNNPYILDGRATAILNIADKPLVRLAGAFVAEVPISEKHIPAAHKILDFATRNLQ